VAGSFRESCGCDAYKGVDVTPLRLKSTWNHRSGTTLVSYVALHNAACKRGMFALADAVFDLLSSTIRFPFSEREDCGYVAWVDPRKTADQIKAHNSRCRRRFNRKLQRSELRTWSISNRPYKAVTMGWSEMLRVASLKGTPTIEKWWDPRLAPASADGYYAPSRGSVNNIRLIPGRHNIHLFVPPELVVRAYQYTDRRAVSLTLQWHQDQTW
jgi:hypothetical protein